MIAGDRFFQVNRANLTSRHTIPTGKGDATADVTPDGKKLYVACSADDPVNSTGSVLVYATSTNVHSTASGASRRAPSRAD